MLTLGKLTPESLVHIASSVWMPWILSILNINQNYHNDDSLPPQSDIYEWLVSLSNLENKFLYFGDIFGLMCVFISRNPGMTLQRWWGCLVSQMNVSFSESCLNLTDGISYPIARVVWVFSTSLSLSLSLLRMKLYINKNVNYTLFIPIPLIFFQCMEQEKYT